MPLQISARFHLDRSRSRPERDLAPKTLPGRSFIDLGSFLTDFGRSLERCLIIFGRFANDLPRFGAPKITRVDRSTKQNQATMPMLPNLGPAECAHATNRPWLCQGLACQVKTQNIKSPSSNFMMLFPPPLPPPRRPRAFRKADPNRP